MITVSGRFSKAISFAITHHSGEAKRGTIHPYIYHPLTVAALVLQYGGTEDQAMAAVLHDTIADGKVTQKVLESRFGEKVADLVFAFSDPETQEGASWKDIRNAYISKVGKCSFEALLVIACEELHEIRELVHDLKHSGKDAWKRSDASEEDLIWYFESLQEVFQKKLNRTAVFAHLIAEFSDELNQLKTIRG